MTKKQIKKAVELAEGFSVNKSLVNSKYDSIDYKGCLCFINDIRDWEHYPLLLYRAMEAVNKTYPDKDIVIYEGYIAVLPIEKKEYFIEFINYTPNPYLTAQEQTLEAALEEVL